MSWKLLFLALTTVSIGSLTVFTAILTIAYPKPGGITTVCLLPIMILVTFKTINADKEEYKNRRHIR